MGTRLDSDAGRQNATSIPLLNTFPKNELGVSVLNIMTLDRYQWEKLYFLEPPPAPNVPKLPIPALIPYSVGWMHGWDQFSQDNTKITTRATHASSLTAIGTLHTTRFEFMDTKQVKTHPYIRTYLI